MDETSYLQCTLYEDVFKKVENGKCYKLSRMFYGNYGGKWILASTIHTRVEEIVGKKIEDDDAALAMLDSLVPMAKELLIKSFESVR